MTDFIHRVKVFVFKYEEHSPNYLLLRRTPSIESFWSPLHASIEHGEQMEAAIKRSVTSDMGFSRPSELIDLDMPSRVILGDEEVIEWNYGYRLLPERDREPELNEDHWSDYLWADFGVAYPYLELEPDRAAILRLHTRLSVN